MQLAILSFNHRATPLALREALAFSSNVASEITKKLCASEVVSECMTLITCNRTEFYAVGPCADGIVETILGELAGRLDCKQADLREVAEICSSKDALAHIFKVASSIDSMVIGEAEILGQFKIAYQTAVENQTVGSYLHKICHAAFRVSKRVRTETEIAMLPVSIGTLAVDLANEVAGGLSERTVLLVGAGKMGRLVASHMRSRFSPRLLVTSRTIASSELAAAISGGEPLPFDQLASAMKIADVIVTSASGGQLISRLALEKIADGKKRVIIDLGVPRNVEPSANEVSGVTVFNIDHFSGLSEKNLLARRAASSMACSIIDVEAAKCFTELANLKLAPLIEELQKQAFDVVTNELKRVFSNHPDLTSDERSSIEQLANNVAAKMIQNPIRLAKEELARSGTSKGDVEALLRQILS